MALKAIAVAMLACIMILSMAHAEDRQCVFTGTSCALSAAYALSLPAPTEDVDMMTGKLAAYSYGCGKHADVSACIADKANFCRWNPNVAPSCDVNIPLATAAPACGITVAGTACVVYTAANSQCTSQPTEACPAPYCKVANNLCTIDTTTGAAPFLAGAIDSGSTWAKALKAAASACTRLGEADCKASSAVAVGASAASGLLAFKPFSQDLTDGMVTTIGADGAYKLIKPITVAGMPVATVPTISDDGVIALVPKPTDANATTGPSDSAGGDTTTTTTGSNSADNKVTDTGASPAGTSTAIVAQVATRNGTTNSAGAQHATASLLLLATGALALLL